MTQLNEIKEGKLKLKGLNFKLHTSKTDFDAMLPNKLQFASQKLSVAKISEGQAIPGRAIVSTTEGRILKCTYTFRTALGSKSLQEHRAFAITSEPTTVENEPKGHTEAIVGNK